MPTISMKQQQRGQTLILSFAIASARSDSSSITEPINVNDLVLVRFKLRHNKITYYNDGLESSITLKKISNKKSSSSTVRIKITCEKFDEECDCTDDWAEKEMLNKVSDFIVNDTIFSSLEVKLTAYETKTSPPQTHKLYDDTELVDFHLTAADGNVGIHKALLAMHSDVFRMMFIREWKETLEGEIGLKGVTKQTLEDLKKYIYLGTLPDEGLEPLLVIGARYMMDELQADCIAKMVQRVTAEKLDDLVEFACLNNVPDLMRAVLFETPYSVVASLYELKMKKGDESVGEDKE